MLRKRDGGTGQQFQIVPLTGEFDKSAIGDFMSDDLPDGVRTENIALLLAAGHITQRVIPSTSFAGQSRVVYDIVS